MRRRLELQRGVDDVVDGSVLSVRTRWLADGRVRLKIRVHPLARTYTVYVCADQSPPARVTKPKTARRKRAR